VGDRMRTIECAIAVVALSAMACVASGQLLSGSVGVTSSSVEWIYPGPDNPPAGRVKYAFSGKNRRSMTVALGVQHTLTSWLALRTGAALVSKGFEVTGPTIQMRYLEVPALVVLQTGRRGRLFVEGGVVGGLRTSCRRFFETTTGVYQDGCGRSDYQGNILPPLRISDVSWELGVGVSLIPFMGGRWGVVARREGSLRDIQPGDYGKMINRVVSLSLFYERDLRRAAERR